MKQVINIVRRSVLVLLTGALAACSHDERLRKCKSVAIWK
jgi:hypothetical protein